MATTFGFYSFTNRFWSWYPTREEAEQMQIRAIVTCERVGHIQTHEDGDPNPEANAFESERVQ